MSLRHAWSVNRTSPLAMHAHADAPDSPGRHHRRSILLGTLVLLLAISGAAVGHADEVLNYVLRPQPADRELEVELTWQTRGRNTSILSVSRRWGQVRDVAGLLRDVSFSQVHSAQRDQNRWLIRHPRGATITCRYRVDSDRQKLDWDGTHYPVTTATFFHGLGNAFLLVPDHGDGAARRLQVTLRWELPEEWTGVCSWGTGRHVGARLDPADLRHSVYLAGRLITKTVQRDGHSVTVAALDRFDFELDDFAQMAAAIVAGQCAFMGETQFPPFVVTAVPVGEAVKAGDSRLSGAGLYQSFALFMAPNSTLTDAIEHLFAHELFHYWNGRLLGAEQPERLVYWFVEGFTDYYSLRILHESGHWTAAQYAKWVNRHLQEYHRNPAQHARNEDIEKNYWSERETVGEVAYQRGHLLGLRWHRLAREHGVSTGLDRLFKTLVERGRGGTFKLSNSRIRQAGCELLGDWFADDFDRFVLEAETVDVPKNALEPELAGHITAVYEHELGFERDRSLKERRVRGLRRGSHAEKAGLREGDELAGWSLYGDPNRKAELKIMRAGRIMTISFYPRGAREDMLQFEPASEHP
ncbi:MAG: hypothetical protein KKB50_06535 [Planctomycetes bacterium]|nr:hypothetical protein [Planctomycetota bacterium]